MCEAAAARFASGHRGRLAASQGGVGLADVFVSVPDGALLVTAARGGCLAFGHR